MWPAQRCALAIRATRGTDAVYRSAQAAMPSRVTRRKRLHLPVAHTGERTGNCFIAAMLAHAHELDLTQSKVSKNEMQHLRAIINQPKGYLAGDKQQLLAEHMQLGYIFVQPDTMKAQRFRARDSDKYALLLLQRRHTEPLVTSANTCKPLTLREADDFLHGYGVELVARSCATPIDQNAADA